MYRYKYERMNISIYAIHTYIATYRPVLDTTFLAMLLAHSIWR